MKKIVSITTIISAYLFLFASSASAAFLPREFELPIVRGLRRDSLLEYIAVIIRTALSIVGAILLVMIVYAGFVYLTAGVGEKRVEKAKNTLTYAIIGIIIIAGAWIISDFIIKNILRK